MHYMKKSILVLWIFLKRIYLQHSVSRSTKITFSVCNRVKEAGKDSIMGGYNSKIH
jgi:hypothetical protein